MSPAETMALGAWILETLLPRLSVAVAGGVFAWLTVDALDATPCTAMKRPGRDLEQCGRGWAIWSGQVCWMCRKSERRNRPALGRGKATR